MSWTVIAIAKRLSRRQEYGIPDCTEIMKNLDLNGKTSTTFVHYGFPYAMNDGQSVVPFSDWLTQSSETTAVSRSGVTR